MTRFLRPRGAQVKQHLGRQIAKPEVWIPPLRLCFRPSGPFYQNSPFLQVVQETVRPRKAPLTPNKVQCNSVGVAESAVASSTIAVGPNPNPADIDPNHAYIVKSTSTNPDPPAAIKASRGPPVHIESNTEPALPLALVSSLYTLKILPFERYRICSEADLTSFLNWDSQTRKAYFLMFVETKQLSVVQCIEALRVLGEYAKRGAQVETP
jgi:hypothetical protein